MRLDDLGVAIFQKLDADTTLGGMVATITTNPPQMEVSEDPADFPIVYLGDNDAAAFDTKTDNGTEATVTIRVSDLDTSKRLCNQVLDRIFTVLHRQELAIAGANFIDCQRVAAEGARQEPDGVTMTGFITFTVLYDEI